MRFFTVFDLLWHTAGRRGESEDEMYQFFRSRKVFKRNLTSLGESGEIPSDPALLIPILEYLNMTKLELQLALNYIPSDYLEAYFANIKQIAALLQNDSLPVNDKTQDEEISACHEPYFATDLGTLYNGDCLDLFSIVPDGSVDCVFADPPFNLNKEYDEGINDRKSSSEYISWCLEWIQECARVLKPGGSLFIYNIPKWSTYFVEHLNHLLTFRDWITVDMKFSLPIRNRLYPAHYSLLYYIKGDRPNTFNPQRIPLQTCRHCGGELRDYGGYKGKMNPNGVNVSDVWSDIYPVRHKNSKNRAYNELPVKLLDRVITMSTNEDDLVLDPFGGSGTTYAVCELLGRHWIGFELGDCDVIKERLLSKENDIRLLNRVYEEERDKLFPDSVKALRRANGFWLEEDVREDRPERSSQLTIF